MEPSSWSDDSSWNWDAEGQVNDSDSQFSDINLNQNSSSVPSKLLKPDSRLSSPHARNLEADRNMEKNMNPNWYNQSDNYDRNAHAYSQTKSDPHTNSQYQANRSGLIDSSDKKIEKGNYQYQQQPDLYAAYSSHYSGSAGRVSNASKDQYVSAESNARKIGSEISQPTIRKFDSTEIPNSAIPQPRAQPLESWLQQSFNQQDNMFHLHQQELVQQRKQELVHHQQQELIQQHQQELVHQQQDLIQQHQQELIRQQEEELKRRQQEEQLIRHQQIIKQQEEDRNYQKQQELLKRQQAEQLIKEQQIIKQQEEELSHQRQQELLKKQQEEQLLKQQEIIRKQEEERNYHKQQELMRKQQEEQLIKQQEINRQQEEERNYQKQQELLKKQQEVRLYEQQEVMKQEREERLEKQREEARIYQEQQELLKQQQDELYRQNQQEISMQQQVIRHQKSQETHDKIREPDLAHEQLRRESIHNEAIYHQQREDILNTYNNRNLILTNPISSPNYGHKKEKSEEYVYNKNYQSWQNDLEGGTDNNFSIPVPMEPNYAHPTGTRGSEYNSHRELPIQDRTHADYNREGEDILLQAQNINQRAIHPKGKLNIDEEDPMNHRMAVEGSCEPLPFSSNIPSNQVYQYGDRYGAENYPINNTPNWKTKNIADSSSSTPKFNPSTTIMPNNDNSWFDDSNDFENESAKIRNHDPTDEICHRMEVLGVSHVDNSQVVASQSIANKNSSQPAPTAFRKISAAGSESSHSGYHIQKQISNSNINQRRDNTDGSESSVPVNNKMASKSDKKLESNERQNTRMAIEGAPEEMSYVNTSMNARNPRLDHWYSSNAPDIPRNIVENAQNISAYNIGRKVSQNVGGAPPRNSEGFASIAAEKEGVRINKKFSREQNEMLTRGQRPSNDQASYLTDSENRGGGHQMVRGQSTESDERRSPPLEARTVVGETCSSASATRNSSVTTQKFEKSNRDRRDVKEEHYREQKEVKRRSEGGGKRADRSRINYDDGEVEYISKRRNRDADLEDYSHGRGRDRGAGGGSHRYHHGGRESPPARDEEVFSESSEEYEENERYAESGRGYERNNTHFYRQPKRNDRIRRRENSVSNTARSEDGSSEDDYYTDQYHPTNLPRSQRNYSRHNYHKPMSDSQPGGRSRQNEYYNQSKYYNRDRTYVERHSRPSSRSGSEYRNDASLLRNFKAQNRSFQKSEFYAEPASSDVSYGGMADKRIEIPPDQWTMASLMQFRSQDPYSYSVWYKRWCAGPKKAVDGKNAQESAGMAYQSHRRASSNSSQSADLLHMPKATGNKRNVFSSQAEDGDMYKYIQPNTMIGKFSSWGRLLLINPGYFDTVKIFDCRREYCATPDPEDHDLISFLEYPVICDETDIRLVSEFLKMAIEKTENPSEQILHQLILLFISLRGVYDKAAICELLYESYDQSIEVGGKKDDFERPVKFEEKEKMSVIDFEKTFMKKLARKQTLALDWAIANSEWAHALMLAHHMHPETMAATFDAFINSFPTSHPLRTYQQISSAKLPEATTLCRDKNWGDWRLHLATILSDHKADSNITQNATVALGDSLASRGDICAAHFCYVVAQLNFNPDGKLTLLSVPQDVSVLDDCANYYAIILTLIYEYAKKLHKKSYIIQSLVPYKFMLAERLAYYGKFDESLEYLKSIASEITGESAFRNHALTRSVLDLAERIKDLESATKSKEWLIRLNQFVANYTEEASKSNSITDDISASISRPSTSAGFAIADYQNNNSSELTRNETPQSDQLYQPSIPLICTPIANAEGGVPNSMFTSTTVPGGMSDPSGTSAPGGMSGTSVPNAPSGINAPSGMSGTGVPNAPGSFDYSSQPLPTYNMGQPASAGDEYSQAYSPLKDSEPQPSSSYAQQGGAYQPNQYQYDDRNSQAWAGQEDNWRGESTNDGNQGTDAQTNQYNANATSGYQGVDWSAASQQGIRLPTNASFDYYANQNTLESNEKEQSQRGNNTNEASNSSKENAGKSEKASEANEEKGKAASGGWLTGIFSLPKIGNPLRLKNQMHLPDDTKKDIVWSEEKQRWLTTNGDDADEGNSPPPPPKSMNANSSAPSFGGQPMMQQQLQQEAMQQQPPAMLQQQQPVMQQQQPMMQQQQPVMQQQQPVMQQQQPMMQQQPILQQQMQQPGIQQLQQPAMQQLQQPGMYSSMPATGQTMPPKTGYSISGRNMRANYVDPWGSNSRNQPANNTYQQQQQQPGSGPASLPL